MPKRGRTPKPAGQAQGHRKTELVPLTGGLADVPEPPVGLLAATVKAWERYWTSDVSKVALDVDLPALGRLFQMYDEQSRSLAAYRKQRTVDGSQGQPRLNPHAEMVLKWEQAISRAEANFGLTPLDRQRLKLAVGQAHKTIEDLNRAANASEDEGRETEDPRLLASVEFASQDE